MFGPFDLTNASKKCDKKYGICHHPLGDKNDVVVNNNKPFDAQLK